MLLRSSEDIFMLTIDIRPRFLDIKPIITMVQWYSIYLQETSLDNTSSVTSVSISQTLLASSFRVTLAICEHRCSLRGLDCRLYKYLSVNHIWYISKSLEAADGYLNELAFGVVHFMVLKHHSLGCNNIRVTYTQTNQLSWHCSEKVKFIDLVLCKIRVNIIPVKDLVFFK
jgi:hypothetical protein